MWVRWILAVFIMLFTCCGRRIVRDLRCAINFPGAEPDKVYFAQGGDYDYVQYIARYSFDAGVADKIAFTFEMSDSHWNLGYIYVDHSSEKWRPLSARESKKLAYSKALILPSSDKQRKYVSSMIYDGYLYISFAGTDAQFKWVKTKLEAIKP